MSQIDIISSDEQLLASKKDREEKAIIDELQCENLHMPRALIQDLLKMYSNMTPEQKKAFDEDVEKAKIQAMEQELEMEQDNTKAYNFSSHEEADEFLKAEGKIEELPSQEV